MNLFLDCPYKWKRVYIDGIKSEPSPAQEKGIRIHEKIEKFYKNMKPDPEIKKFIASELKRVKRLKDIGKAELKYFKPIFQELYMEDKELGLKGFVDAVYINPTDDELIVIDYKSGRYYPNKLDDYRFELAVYSELLKVSGKCDAPKYWGIYFVEQDKMFFEKIDDEYIRRMYATVERVREGIKSGKFPATRNCWCRWCQFKEECEK